MKVDLRSDTVTQPTPGMLEAMMSAQVGDDVLGDDPSVNALEARAAELSGMEAAVFTPSGTMANQIAIRCWTQPGDEVFMEQGGHPYHYESGAAAVISGVQIRLLQGTGGILGTEAVAQAVRPANVHFAPATLVVIENTANRGGGSVYPLEVLDGHAAQCRELGLRLHLDGARVFNAAVALGVPLSRVTRGFDSVAFCLSKGLGAPVGSLLCGPAEMIGTARRVRKMLGGGMRQAGYLAAAGSYALEHHVARLGEDHRRAKALWAGLVGMGLEAREPETNMVYVRVPGAVDEVVAGLGERGVACLEVGSGVVRLVTHLGVDDGGVEVAVAAFREVCGLG